MQPHEERVVIEKRELDEKLAKLSAFFDTIVFSGLHQEDRDLLRDQYTIMQEYSKVLGRRVSRFAKGPDIVVSTTTYDHDPVGTAESALKR